MPKKNCESKGCTVAFKQRVPQHRFCSVNCRVNNARANQCTENKKYPHQEQGTNRCVYDPDVHGLGLDTDSKPGACGLVTANRGYNRYYCATHHSAMSIRVSDIR